MIVQHNIITSSITACYKPTHVLTQVTVEDPKTGEAVDFHCRRWLSKTEDDGQISRELSRGDGKDGDMSVDKGRDNVSSLGLGLL